MGEQCQTHFRWRMMLLGAMALVLLGVPLFRVSNGPLSNSGLMGSILLGLALVLSLASFRMAKKCGWRKWCGSLPVALLCAYLLIENVLRWLMSASG